MIGGDGIEEVNSGDVLGCRAHSHEGTRTLQRKRLQERMALTSNLMIKDTFADEPFQDIEAGSFLRDKLNSEMGSRKATVPMKSFTK